MRRLAAALAMVLALLINGGRLADAPEDIQPDLVECCAPGYKIKRCVPLYPEPPSVGDPVVE